MNERLPQAMANAFDPATIAGLAADSRTLIERRQRVLGPAYRLFYEEPLHFVRGEGVWLIDPDGNRYLDAYNNVAAVGHCHPRVVEAIARQAGRLNTHTRYLHETILDYAERLLATFPPQLGHVMFTCTGSEANDLALRIAKAFTGASGVIVTAHAYHGVTDAISQLSPSLGAGVPRGRHVRLVPAPDPYRGSAADVAAVFAGHVRRAIEGLQADGFGVAAMFCDTIFSSDGIFTEPEGFLRAAVDNVRDAGGLFVADEVQPGFGRTGTAMWGFARHGLVPDLATLGKPMGNGHPVAAVALKPRLIEEFGRKARYFNTFGGNPVSCAAALATLDVIEEEKLQANALDVGMLLIEALRQMAARHPLIGDVRGRGLFVGVELVEEQSTRKPATAAAARLVNELRRRRILISATGPFGNILKIRPPLVFTREHAGILLEAMEAALADQRCG